MPTISLLPTAVVMNLFKPKIPNQSPCQRQDLTTEVLLEIQLKSNLQPSILANRIYMFMKVHDNGNLGQTLIGCH